MMKWPFSPKLSINSVFLVLFVIMLFVVKLLVVAFEDFEAVVARVVLLAITRYVRSQDQNRNRRLIQRPKNCSRPWRD